MPLTPSLCFLALVLVSLWTTVVPVEAAGGIEKALPTLFLAGCAWYYTRPRFGPWVAVGVLLGAMGDYSLASAERSWFLAGVVTFLLGHLAYSAAFAKEMKGIRARVILILVTAGMMVALVTLVSFRMVYVGEQALIIPVSVYAVVLSIMMAITVLHQSPTRLIAAGGFVFVISDAHIVLNHMFLSSPCLALALSGYATYYLAQYCLVAGASYETRYHQNGGDLDGVAS